MKKQNRITDHIKGRIYVQKLTGLQFLLVWVDLDDGSVYLYNHECSCCEDLSVFVPENYTILK